MSIVIESGKQGEYTYIIRQNKDCRNYQLIVIDWYQLSGIREQTTIPNQTKGSIRT